MHYYHSSLHDNFFQLPHGHFLTHHFPDAVYLLQINIQKQSFFF